MKKIISFIAKSIICFIVFISILVFFPQIAGTIDRWLLTEKEIALMEKQAMNGDTYAIYKLITFSKSRQEEDKWSKLLKEIENSKDEEYSYLKKESEDGNATATFWLKLLEDPSYCVERSHYNLR